MNTMNRNMGLAGLLALVAASSAAWAAPIMAVDWGGNYVTAYAGSQRAATQETTVNYGGTATNDVRKYAAFSETTPLNPTINAAYTGISGGTSTSAIYYGGANLIKYDSATLQSYFPGVNNSTTDVIQFYGGENIAWSGEIAGVALWKKANFLNGADAAANLYLTSDCSLGINVNTLLPSNGVSLRLLVKNGNTWYVSNTAKTTGTGWLTISNPVAETWATYTPDNRLNNVGSDFAVRSFNDVQAIGFLFMGSGSYVSYAQAKVQDVEFKVNTTPEPATMALLAALAPVLLLRRRHG